ncbi:MAG: exosortase U [Planctomycetaceae bacterium]
MTQAEHNKSNTPVLLIATLCGLILTQMLANRPEVTSRGTPGATRGDVPLHADVLPETIGDWKQQSFQAAPPVESLPNGQYWWTHAWQYADGRMAANVSFDQADWAGWHELTECYEGNGWKLVERSIQTPSDTSEQTWPYVVATFEKGLNQKGTLLFSEFYEDGSPTPPREFEVGAALKQELGLGQRFGNRTNYEAQPVVVLHERVMQCQVFATYIGTLNKEQHEALKQLHTTSRTRFQEEWLAARSQAAPSTAQPYTTENSHPKKP